MNLFQKNSNFSIGDNVWPKPQIFSTEETFFSIDPKTFRFVHKIKGKCDLLDKTIDRYRKYLFLEDCSLVSDSQTGYKTLFDRKRNLKVEVNYLGHLSNITIRVNQECEYEPHPDINEFYTIRINSQKSEIFAQTVWGAIRAVETFSQLIENIGLNQFVVNSTNIEDFPRFKFRGLLVDTSRHFIPIKRLEQSLDAMAFNKMNVFHWHIVDDQSFPYVSQIFPDLSLKGAYNPKTHIYSSEDINHIIEYAKERGIRVLVEFDTPGHTQAWGKGQTGLLTPCYTGDKPNGHFGPIDPTKETTFQFIKELFTEVVQRFPEQYLHLGGDEVDYECWRSNPRVIEFLRHQKLIKKSQTIGKKTNEPFLRLEEYYIQKVIDIVKDLNKSCIVWQEVFDNKARIQSDTIIHVWKSDNWQNSLFNITSKGYQSILSSCWYLNKISYGSDWHKYYNCEPLSFNGTQQQNQLVIGGEATMWGNYQSIINTANDCFVYLGEWVDASNIIGRTWFVILLIYYY